MPDWATGNMLSRLLRLAGVCAVGGTVFFAALAILGFRVKDFARQTQV
jgi:putative peptidoglycan lipid II flippase